MPANNKRKGSNLERKVRTDLLPYFPMTKTSRMASKLMDDCQIDLCFLPLNIQCKAGYNRNRPKYEELYLDTKRLLNQHIPKDDRVHTYPYVLIHKLNTTRKLAPEFMQVTISYEFFLRLIELSHDRL